MQDDEYKWLPNRRHTNLNFFDSPPPLSSSYLQRFMPLWVSGKSQIWLTSFMNDL